MHLLKLSQTWHDVAALCNIFVALVVIAVVLFVIIGTWLGRSELDAVPPSKRPQDPIGPARPGMKTYFPPLKDRS